MIDRKDWTEKEFENKVKEFLKDNHCWCLKTWGNGVQRKGIPDLLICCNGIFLGVELKSQIGHFDKEGLQMWNIKQIREAGGVSMVLRPDQFEAFKILIKEINEMEKPIEELPLWVFKDK